MNTRRSSRWFWTLLAVVCLTVAFFPNEAATQPQNPAANANVKAADGLTVITFTVNPGTIVVNLPDDMRAGDTISGTVTCEPKGNTKEERGENRLELSKFELRLKFAGLGEQPKKVSCGDVARAFTGVAPYQDERVNGLMVELFEKLGKALAQMNVPVPTHPSGAIITPDPKITPPGMTPKGAVITPDPKITPPGMTPKGAVITPDPKITPSFIIPPLGQTGRPIVITGPFDGDSSTTILNFFQAHSQAPLIHQPDLEYESEIVRNSAPLLAESPRKAVFEAPTKVTGPIEVKLKEGSVETKGTFRNVGVDLTAPKTSLLKGESTTLRVEVSGLEGIKRPMPLTLESRGVITMDGGIYQPLVIQPSQVGADGRYITTRGITGVQAGGWGATATVVTHRFDVCLQDPTREFVLVWNTFNGEYVFANPFPPKPPGQPPQTGSTTPPSLTGTGKITMKGCVFTLEHNAPDRRVMSTIDQCTHTGSASVQTVTPKVKFTITDRSTTDNTCSMQ